ncbi:hypothetical protein HMPREF6745_0348 [Prevotella sp. oral taxon 472 str. F0295]|nr:hypothetical protein HMPREF6745_0348 [Prevotella sp. oral taxon 472 str. F0295]
MNMAIVSNTRSFSSVYLFNVNILWFFMRQRYTIIAKKEKRTIKKMRKDAKF